MLSITISGNDVAEIKKGLADWSSQLSAGESRMNISITAADLKDLPPLPLQPLQARRGYQEIEKEENAEPAKTEKRGRGRPPSLGKSKPETTPITNAPAAVDATVKPTIVQEIVAPPIFDDEMVIMPAVIENKNAITKEEAHAALDILKEKKGIPACLLALQAVGVGKRSELTEPLYLPFVTACNKLIAAN